MERSLILGRDPSADLPVADGSVSRHHAEIRRAGPQRLFITDRQSSNGTYLRRRGVESQISQETVETGDEVRFGGVVVAVSDLLNLVDEKLRPAAGALLAQMEQSAQLLRCDCGAIKRKGTLCDLCGE